jgi:hypothetical protein
MSEEIVIGRAREHIDNYHIKIRDLKAEIKQYEENISNQYQIIRDTCTHNWVREREPVPYGELCIVCTRCYLKK